MSSSDSIPSQREHAGVITRREAMQRVGALLGGIAFIGGGTLMAACERAPAGANSAVANGEYKPVGQFTAADVALLDEVADTILPRTKTPGAKDAGVGPFMAVMVTDTYKPGDQQIFRDGLRALDAASQKQAGAPFMQATPQARLALVQALDREQKTATDAREAALKAAGRRAPSTGPNAPKPGTVAAAGKKIESKAADANLPDSRQENAGTSEVASGAAVADDIPKAHYFRMIKELTLLGYFTSDVVGRLPTDVSGKRTERYVDTPGQFIPCAPYVKGQPAMLPHA